MDEKLLRKYVEYNEGRTNAVYFDSRGIETIGVGFNLRRANSKEIVENLGIDYDNVIRGETLLSDDQIDSLLYEDLANALRDCIHLFECFNAIDGIRQIILTDMAFNLGYTGLAGFKKMIAAVDARDWDTAADEAKDSRWYRQVGMRGPRNVDALRSGHLSFMSKVWRPE